MDDSQDMKGPDFAPSVPSGVKPDAYDAPYNQWLLAGGKPRDAKDKVISDLRARLAAAERERERLQDCLSNVHEWLFDRASRLGAVGLYPDDLAEEVEAVLAQTDTKERERQ